MRCSLHQFQNPEGYLASCGFEKTQCNLLLRPALKFFFFFFTGCLLFTLYIWSCLWLFQEKQKLLFCSNGFSHRINWPTRIFFKVWHKTWSPIFFNELKLNVFPLDLTRVKYQMLKTMTYCCDIYASRQAASIPGPSFSSVVAGKGERAWGRGFSTRKLPRMSWTKLIFTQSKW